MRTPLPHAETSGCRKRKTKARVSSPARRALLRGGDRNGKCRVDSAVQLRRSRNPVDGVGPPHRPTKTTQTVRRAARKKAGATRAELGTRSRERPSHYSGFRTAVTPSETPPSVRLTALRGNSESAPAVPRPLPSPKNPVVKTGVFNAGSPAGRDRPPTRRGPSSRTRPPPRRWPAGNRAARPRGPALGAHRRTAAGTRRSRSTPPPEAPVLGESLRLRIGVGVERALGTASRPEPAAAEFVRVPLDHHPVAAVGRAPG